MSTMFDPAPEPATELGRYRILSSTAGVRVSPLCLGAMSIGSAWNEIMGTMTKEASFALLDHFHASGGNFIDTANNYQNEQSESILGEWMETRQNRDFIFLATKYTVNYPEHKYGRGKTVNYCGNHKKSLHLSVRDSLAKLRTDYIDLLYLHWWDWASGIEEVMDSLHILVTQGKVLYLGISDTPAWIVSAANTYARQQGKTPFSVYQGRWNLGRRDMEREIIPMARHFGMAICPWDVIGGGRFRSKAQIEELKKSGEGIRKFLAGSEQTEMEVKISAALESVANEVGATLAAVAIAYIMAKAPNVYPIVGGRKTEHLDDNIKALSLELSKKQIETLEAAYEFDVGFPGNFVGGHPRETGISGPLVEASAKIKWDGVPW